VGPTSQMRVGIRIVAEIRCFGVVFLERGVDPRGVDLGSVSFSEVWTSQLSSAYLECCFAALHKPSTVRVGITHA
jgi:hypothetical protein